MGTDGRSLDDNGPMTAPTGGFVRLLRVYVPRAYLTRFPILLAVLLVAAVPFALLVVPAVFRSMLVLDAVGMALVTLAATAAALTVLATRRIVLLHGPARFDVAWPDVAPALSRRALAGHLALAAPLVGTAWWLSATEGRVGWLRATVAVVAGLASASVFTLGAALVHALLADAAEPMPELVVPSNPLVRAAHERQSPAPSPSGWPPRLARWLRPWLGPGYLDAGDRVLPAHRFAAGILLVYCLLYIVGYVAFQPGRATGAAVPALTYLLAVATLATWLLAGIAFYLDRHRLPTLLPLVLWSFVVWGVSKSDHYFPLMDAPRAAPLATPQAIAASRHPRLLAVVAVDGGGIQAAGWAATVLTGIEERWPEFQQSVRLVSGVSGGSVGAMYFVSSLDGSGRYAPATGALVRQRATRGSLSEAAWGLAYPDLWRALLPVPASLRFVRDRGWAMEQAWRRDWPGSPSLADLRRGIAEGWRPAVAFNATRVERGDRFSFATFEVPGAWSVQTLQTLYGGRDIAASTAARVSATFPYVTPISRALPDAGRTARIISATAATTTTPAWASRCAGWTRRWRIVRATTAGSRWRSSRSGPGPSVPTRP